MGFMDTIKAKLGGNKSQVKGGIDKTADVVGDKGGAHADKTADMAKDTVDKLPGA